MYVEKGGEIIPKVVSVEVKNRIYFLNQQNILKIVHPTELIRPDSDAKHYCTNSDLLQLKLLVNLNILYQESHEY